MPAGWVTVDEVYGGSPALRQWLEDRGVSHVLAVKCAGLLEVQAVDAAAGARTSAEGSAARVPAEQWVACCAGHSAKGRRLYDWTRVALAAHAAVGMALCLLVCRSRSGGESAFNACYRPATSPLIGLVGGGRDQVGDRRGLRASQGRGRPGPLRGPQVSGWYRHTPARATSCGGRSRG